MVDKKGGGKGGGKSASNDLKAQVKILDLSVFSLIRTEKRQRHVTRARSQVDRLAFEKTALQARLRELPLRHQEKLESSNHARLQIND